MSDTPTVPVPTAAATRRRRTVILSSLAGVLAVIVVAATVMVVSMRPDSGAPDPRVDLASVSTVGPNPFAALTNATAAPVEATRVDTSLARPASGATQLVGTTPGLYAGSDGSRCDPAALARYLGSDFTRAQAWAGVFGITADQIPYFLNSLTPVTLTADTWVTNHSWEDGVARPFQSVLQAGTPVLVDSEGVPRVRCACGNPLGPPASAPLSGFRTSGAAWPGYQTTRVVHVQTAAPAAAPGQVQASAPASLTVRNASTGDLVQQAFSALLNLASLPPLAKPLPTAASMNVPFRSTDPAVAQSNGVTTQGVALPEMTRAAAGVTVSETATSTTESSAAPAPSTAAAAAATSIPSSSVAPAVIPPPVAPVAPVAPPVESSAALPPPPVESSAPVAGPAPTSEPPSTSAGPLPTKFTGTGSGITGFTYADTSGAPVRCSVQAVPVSTPTEVPPTSSDPSASDTPAPAPETTEATPTDATVTCSDGSTTTVPLTTLSQATVQSSTDTQGVWTVSLGGASIPVTEATWG